MFKDLIKINFGWLKLAFYAGTALGVVVGSVAGTTFGVLVGGALGMRRKTDAIAVLEADAAERAPDKKSSKSRRRRTSTAATRRTATRITATKRKTGRSSPGFRRGSGEQEAKSA